MPNSASSAGGLLLSTILLFDVNEMLPLAVFTVAVTPLMAPIALCNCASVATWPAPVPNVIVVGVPLTLTVNVSPGATAPCVNKLTGWKEFAPAPNPIAVSAVAVPPTVIEAVPFVPVSTRLPVLPPLSVADTFSVLPVCAALMAEIRLATVSLPVEVYVNTEWMPSLMVIWSPLLIPSDANVAPSTC